VDVTHLGTVEGSGRVVIHGDSQRIAVATRGSFLSAGGVAVYSANDLADFKRFPGGGHLAFSRTGEFLALADGCLGNAVIGNWRIYGSVCVVETGAEIPFRGKGNNSPGPQGSDWAEFSPDGSLMALSGAGASPTVYVVDVPSVLKGFPRSDKASTGFSILFELATKGLWSNMALEWSPSGEFLAQVADIREGNAFQVGSNSAQLLLWRLSESSPASASMSHFGTVSLDEAIRTSEPSPSGNVAFAPDSALLAIAGSKAVPVRLIDVKEARIAYSMPYDGMLMTALAFTPGGKYLVSGDGDGSLCAWELRASDSGVSLDPVDSARLPGSVLDFSISSQGSAIVATKKDKSHVDISRVSVPSDAAQRTAVAAPEAVAATQDAAAPDWMPTHVAPAVGLAVWAVPDGRQPAVGQMPGTLELVVEERAGVWALVRDAKGWRGWVDSRLLVVRR